MIVRRHSLLAYRLRRAREVALAIAGMGLIVLLPTIALLMILSQPL